MLLSLTSVISPVLSFCSWTVVTLCGATTAMVAAAAADMPFPLVYAVSAMTISSELVMLPLDSLRSVTKTVHDHKNNRLHKAKGKRPISKSLGLLINFMENKSLVRLPSKLEFNSFGWSSTDLGETYSKLQVVAGRGFRHCTDDDWAENPSPTHKLYKWKKKFREFIYFI